MLSKLRKSNKGFTIIEVLIVLAIAGLILLIVFLAVPALQRNQRNTSRKQDVSRVGGVATEWVSNHNGALPANAAARDTIADSAGHLAQLDLNSVAAKHANLVLAAAGAGVTANLNDITKVKLVTGGKCVDPIDGTATQGTDRQMALLYTNEQAGIATPGGAKLCVDI